VCPIKNHGNPESRKERINSSEAHIHGAITTSGNFSLKAMNLVQKAKAIKYAEQYKLSKTHAIVVTYRNHESWIKKNAAPINRALR